jgi:hypothetical protein
MPEDMGGGGLRDPGVAPDPEWDAYVAWRDREITAGRVERPPEPWEITAATITTGRTSRQEGRAVLRARARPEPQVRAHRQGNVRPPARRGALHPEPQAPAPGPRPLRHLHRTRLPGPGHPCGPGPHNSLPRRSNRRVQPRTQVPHPPSGETGPRLEGRAARARRLPLDPPLRSDPHHPPQHLLNRLIEALG